MLAEKQSRWRGFKKKKKTQTQSCVADKRTVFIKHYTNSGDWGGEISGVLDTITIIGGGSFLDGGDRTYSYKPIWVGPQKLVITNLIKI